MTMTTSEGGPGWLAFILQFTGMIVVGAIAYGVQFNQVNINSQSIRDLRTDFSTSMANMRIDDSKAILDFKSELSAGIAGFRAETSEAFKTERMERRDADINSKGDRENIWASIHAHDLRLQALENSNSEMKELKAEFKADREERDKRFSSSQSQAEAMLMRLDRTSGQLEGVSQQMNRIVDCIVRRDACMALQLTAPTREGGGH